MIDLSFLDELQRFRIMLKKKVNTQFAGHQRAVSYGTGTELMDMREYVLGDDLRLIDWNVYARTEKLHVKRFREEKNLTIHIIIDYSKSMDFGRKHTKYEYAAMIGLGFAYLAMKNNERFEFSAFADQLYALKPKKGARNFLQMIDMIQKLHPEGKTQFEQSLQYYKKLLTSRSLIIILSDFLFDPEAVEEGLLRLGKHHEIKLVQVLDPEEIDFLLQGEVKVIDSETGASLRTFFTNRTLAMYRDEMREHIAQLQAISQRFHADFLTVTTKDNIYEIIGKLLQK